MNTKAGLDYFPLDVDFFNDEKIQFISARFGTKGEAIVIRLMCRIYRNGYFLNWDEDMALLFAKSVGDGCQHSFVIDVVYELLKRGFFDKSIFERFSILTSKGIQNRFLIGAARRKKVLMDERILLIDVSKHQNVCTLKQNVYILSENADDLTQSKVKESKVKESKKRELAQCDMKTKRGEYGWVKLTDVEYNRLLNDFGEDEVKRCIAYIDELAQSTGNKNKWRDWNLVVRRAINGGWGKSKKTGMTQKDALGHAPDANEIERKRRFLETLGNGVKSNDNS